MNKQNGTELWQPYNGIVEAATTLLGALSVFAIGFVPVNWSKFGDVAVITISATSALFLVLISGTEKISLGYCGW